jgi:hypothetical protein
MSHRLVLCVLALAFVLSAQMRMSVQQLVQFLRSSVQLKHPDKQVAASLKSVVLTERLDERTIEDLQGQGVGPRTLEALRTMREASRSQPAAVVVAPPPPPPPLPAASTEEQRKALDQAREYALNYTKQLPNFICTQVTRRFVDPSGLEFWQKADVVTAKLSYFEQKEDYKVVMVNSQPVDAGIHDVGGATSAGEFGTMLREVFEPESKARFEWTRWTTLRGRRHHVFGFRVEQGNSKRSVTYEKTQSVVTAYKGSVFVDADTQMVSRIKVEQEMPPTFPVQQASVELDYDLVDIAGGADKFMLPLKHTMRMRMAKTLVKNEAEFRMYRKFGADTSITFETPEPLPEEKLSEQAPK